MSSLRLARLFEKTFSRCRTRRVLGAKRLTLSHEVVCLEDRVLLAVALGTAESFAVLGGSTVTNTGPTVVSGNLGVSPGSAVTGFPPGIVVPPGTIHSADAVALQAQSDVVIAYNDLAGRASNFDLTGQDLGGLTLVPGVYTFSSSAQLTGTLTLDAQGNPDAEFIFQIGSTITTASNSSVNVINGADGCNVYWQVGSSATLGTNTAFTGNILALTSITLVTNATIMDGRALARNGAVTMDSNQVSIEECGFGSISWEKRTDGANPVLLGGATFVISPDPIDGVGTLTIVDGGLNDADQDLGQIAIFNVLPGSYTITETVPPAGYRIDDDPTRFITVSAGDLHAVVGTQGSDQPGNSDESDFHNTQVGSIAWEKRATDANPVLLGGATFEISPDPIDGVGTLIIVDGGPNDDNPQPGQIALLNVSLGTYTITEIISPAGYTIDDDPTRSVTVTARNPNVVIGFRLGRDNAGNTDESDFHNRLGSIAWEKRATDANPVLLAGATFVISPDPLDGIGTLTVVDGGLNDADGLANGVLLVNSVLLGMYTITETISPAGFAIDDDATRTITVSAGDLNAVVGTQGQNDAGNTDESDFHNRLGSIAWEKRATDANPILLGGATFVISPDPLDGLGTLTVVDGGLNDADGLANGVLLVNNVLLGVYTITETVSPAGFAIDDDATRTITVSAGDLNAVVGTQGQDDAGNTDESDFHNRLGSIAWEKRATNANPVLLGGATFVISPDPLDGIGTLTVVDGGANDADPDPGQIAVINVLLGTYMITETVSPAGFAIDDDATRTITVSAGDLNAVVGTQGQDDTGNTDESDFHNRLVIVIGMGKSPIGPQFVTVIDQDSGAVISQFAPYGSAFRGGVRVATGDLTGDGIDEIVTAPGWSIVGQVNVYSQAGGLLTSFQPYGSTFKGGVQVAVGDVDGDGLNDIITVPSYGPAEVKVFRNVLAGGVPTFDVQNPYRDFLAFPSSFIGGAVVAAADMGSTPLTTGPFDITQRDQKAEIVIGSGAGIKTTVKVFDVSRMTVPTPNAMPAAAQSFTPYSTTTTNYKGGVSLSVARINVDLIPDIVVGAGVNGGSLVDVWAWSNTASATLSSLSANGAGFAAFTDASRTAPVQVAAQDTTGDGIADAILAVQGPGGTTNQIRSFSILSVSPLQVAPPIVIPGSYLGPYVIATIRNPLPPAMMPQPLIASPVVSAPALSRVSNTAHPRFSWSTISNAATYDVWVDRLTSNTSQYLRNTSVSATSLDVTNFDVGQYAVWVRARNAQGDLSHFSSRMVFQVSLAPNNVSVTSTAFNGTPVLGWSAVPGATQYEVWVDNQTTNTSRAVHNTSVTATSLALSGLTAGSYRAWVRARDAQGGSYAWTSTFPFEVQRAAGVLTPIGTANSSAPLISWTAVSGAARYELWVSNLDTLERVIHFTDITSTRFQPTANLIPGQYRVWVRAIDGNGVSAAWSTPANFTVARITSVPSAKSPLKPLAVNLLAEELQTTDEIFSDILSLEQVLLAQANPDGMFAPDAPQQTSEAEVSTV